MKLKLDANGNVALQDGKPVYILDDGREVADAAAATVAEISSLNGEAMSHRQAKEAAEAALKPFKDAAAASQTMANINSGDLTTAAKVQEIKDAATRSANGKLVPMDQQGNPQGLSWLSDTLTGIDLYAGGFICRPTIFFDPGATASLGYGTMQHPYSTQEQLETACRGDMSGEVLGIRRGSITRVAGKGLTLTVHGSPSRPFTICPYGIESDALPVISGAVFVTDWTLVDAAKNIWSNPMGAREYPCWQSGVRINNRAWAGNPAASLPAPGASVYQAGVFYVRPFEGADPRRSAIEIAKADVALNIILDNVAATGYVHVCGIQAVMGYGCGLRVGADAQTKIATMADVRITGCRASNIGLDAATAQGPGDGFWLVGIDKVRMKDALIQGCYASDCTNNAYEFINTSGAKLIKNMSLDCSGNSIVELWSGNDNCLIQHNVGEFSTALHRLAVDPAQGGVWFSNQAVDQEIGIEDATNTENFNNIARFNLIISPGQRGFAAGGGHGHVFQHNTVILDPDATTPGGYYGANAWFTYGNAPTGFVDISNNLFYWRASVTTRHLSCGDLRAGIGANKSNPIGDKNIYCPANPGNYNWGFNSDATYWMEWKSRLLAAGVALDQNSLLYAPEPNASLKRLQLGFNELTNRPISAMARGLTALAVGSRYCDGQPYRPSVATIGALNGY
ncbi:hypothetical protein KIV45_17160 [Janthinobacterium lividum]|nr:hypothetical protein KIV45_17160 [Janthinobacterium lividum]